MSNIAFVGMPFSGKTYIANKLSSILNLPVYDTDIMIANTYKLSLNKIVSIYGIHYFRLLEENIIKYINNLNKNDCILMSCGGGVNLSYKNNKVIMDNYFVIWLDTDFDLLYKRMNYNSNTYYRTNFNMSYNQFFKLYLSRYHLYKNNSHYKISININNFDKITSYISNIYNSLMSITHSRSINI